MFTRSFRRQEEEMKDLNIANEKLKIELHLLLAEINEEGW